MDERREVVVWINERSVLDLFNLNSTEKSALVFHCPIFAALPEGYTVRAVCQDFMRRAFGFAVQHPSFDVVPDGAPAPDWNGSTDIVFSIVWPDNQEAYKACFADYAPAVKEDDIRKAVQATYDRIMEDTIGPDAVVE